MAISSKTRAATRCANGYGRDIGPDSSFGNQRKGENELSRWVSHDSSVCYPLFWDCVCILMVGMLPNGFLRCADSSIGKL